MLPELKTMIRDISSYEDEGVGMENICQVLFNDWTFDLSFQEKQVWLWNSLVEMERIRRRRKNPGRHGLLLPAPFLPEDDLVVALK